MFVAGEGRLARRELMGNTEQGASDKQGLRQLTEHEGVQQSGSNTSSTTSNSSISSASSAKSSGQAPGCQWVLCPSWGTLLIISHGHRGANNTPL